MQGDRKEREAILKMLSAFPQLLGYNPTYLHVLCQRALRFLTSDERYAGCAEDQDSKVSAHFIDHYQSQAEADLIVDIVQQQSTFQNEESSSRHDLEVRVRFMYRMSDRDALLCANSNIELNGVI